MATLILLLVAAAGLAFFLWSPSWLGPPLPEPSGRDDEAGRSGAGTREGGGSGSAGAGGH